jgi:hypothetical protein
MSIYARVCDLILPQVIFLPLRVAPSDALDEVKLEVGSILKSSIYTLECCQVLQSSVASHSVL